MGLLSIIRTTIAFVAFPGRSTTLYDIRKKEQIIAFLDTKIRSQDNERKWITTWNNYLHRLEPFLRWLYNQRLKFHDLPMHTVEGRTWVSQRIHYKGQQKCLNTYERKKRCMEFLTDMVTTIPEGTSPAKVDELRAAEAVRAAELTKAGHLVRLWRPPLGPDEWHSIGLFRTANEAELRETLASLPLHVWMNVTITPLTPHPNDPEYRAQQAKAQDHPQQ